MTTTTTRSRLDAGPVNEELFARYAVEWHEYHGINPRRRTQQLWTLRKFAIRLGTDRSMLDVTSADVRDWLEMKRAGGFAPATIRLHINYFRPFFTWMHQVGLVDDERLRDIRTLRPPKGTPTNAVPRPYTKRERERFWRDFDKTYPWMRYGKRNTSDRGAFFLDRYLRGISRWPRCRHYCMRLQAEAIVMLAMHAGLRRVEIYRLTLDQLDPANEYIVVPGAKGPDGQPILRAVPWLTEQLRQAVEDWLFVRDQLEHHHGGFDHESPWIDLWREDQQRQLPLVKFVGTVAKCGDWRFHRMRHTAATEMLRANMPIQDVSRILGHASLQQTLGYAKLVSADLVASARRARSGLERAMARPD